MVENLGFLENTTVERAVFRNRGGNRGIASLKRNLLFSSPINHDFFPLLKNQEMWLTDILVNLMLFNDKEKK